MDTVYKFQTDKRQVWFTSDLHLYHDKEFVYKERGYNSVEDHVQGVLNKINECVGRDDVLINLGDFCLNASQDDFEYVIDNINCQNMYYVNGNHNSRIKQAYRKAIRDNFGDKFDGFDIYPVTYKNITFWGPYTEVKIGGQYITLFHFPIDIWNNVRKGWWALCGHCHGNFPEIRPEYEKGKILDVGWDNFGGPVSFQEIQTIMDNKDFLKKDHH